LYAEVSIGNEISGGFMKQPFGKLASVFGSLLLSLLVACPPASGVTPDFSFTLINQSVSIKQTQTGTQTISLTKTGGFQGAITFSLEGAPTGIMGSFTQVSVTDSSLLTLNVAATAALGNSTLTVKGVSGALTRTKTFNLNVTAAPTTGDITPPTVVSTLAKSNTSVEVVFDEQVVGGNVASNFSVPQQGLGVTAASVAADGKTVTLTTSSQTNTSYALLVSSSLTDVAGNAYDLAKQPANKTTFQGIAAGAVDTTPPTIASTTATSSTTVVIVFSEAIAPASVVAAQFGFVPSLTSSAAVLGADGKTVTVTTSTQTHLTAYAVILNNNFAVAKVKDLAGNEYVSGNDGSHASFDGF
jgi:Bacterial Ig-like domain